MPMDMHWYSSKGGEDENQKSNEPKQPSPDRLGNALAQCTRCGPTATHGVTNRRRHCTWYTGTAVT